MALRARLNRPNADRPTACRGLPTGWRPESPGRRGISTGRRSSTATCWAFRAGGFRDHDGYDGVFFALPGGGELELTSGPAEPRPGTEEDLLVLYLGTAEEVSTVAGALREAGAAGVTSPNAYWNRWGRTFLDPDGQS